MIQAPYFVAKQQLLQGVDETISHLVIETHTKDM